ncbi:mannitol dehydrogenase family protein [Pseudoxanthomonas dokdonensis]|uniref:Mannitol dehydrogenase n=1 Tax=Pseudoxanthomonas dokdonensis TaxID=344882 RepID=A0A0R0CFI2_9GAMM|nr:mannitol dehydrogenase family protein [Pseudoxanthomonas dokdonensis]KRG68495.1 mannitol dehydrogenase [Pseudoxanthomonas dokdonensis]
MSEDHAPLPRLDHSRLPTLAAGIGRPGYDPAAVRVGIVHIGVGAFHRAHQAVYIDDVLAIDPRWGICGVSLHSGAVRDALAAQDGLYTLALLQHPPALRVIGAVRELLCARDQGDQVLQRMADPAIRIVSLTITEKGYCLAGEELDTTHPDIVHDQASPMRPRSAIGLLVAALALRRQRGVAAFTALSCDNLADNGGKLRRAVLQFAGLVDPALADWIRVQASFPCSMVDSITPATDEATRERVAAALGCIDAWPVQREPYTQWVVEDDFRHGRPALEQVGVTMSADIAAHDQAKLRLLNGAHSSLAYIGLLRGHQTVAGAMDDPALAAFVERLMRRHIAPTLRMPPAFDSDGYISAILQRFANPAIQHQLSQIAWDGSQKLPVRLLGTLADRLADAHDIDALSLPIVAWMRFVQRQANNGVALVDPISDALTAIGLRCNGEPAHDLGLFLGLDAMFAGLATEPCFAAALLRADARLQRGDFPD